MSSRLLALCLRAYPRSTRERDGDYLLDLALELADADGVHREALSLLRGGLAQRAHQVTRPVLWLVGGTVAGVLALGGVAVADPGSVLVEVRVEVRSCSASGCAGVRAWAAGLASDGWACERTVTPGEVSWQCVAP